MTTPQADTGPGLRVFAEISASLGSIASKVEYWHKRRSELFRQIHQVPIQPGNIALTAGAGILQAGDILGPSTGQCWSIRRLTATGFSAGTVTVYKNPVVVGTTITGDTLVPFASAGTFTFGRGEMLLMPDEFIAFQAASITGTVTIVGIADQFEAWLLPDYIL